jgi:hypothetical protein
MASSGIQQLWAKLGPDVLPEFANSQHLLAAFKEERIDEEEFRRLDAAITERDRGYRAELGYPDDDDEG